MTKWESQIAKASKDRWGIHSQVMLCIEEMSELTYALIRLCNMRNPDLVNIAEELADVEIMVEHLKTELRVTDSVKLFRKEKFRRVEAKLQGNKREKRSIAEMWAEAKTRKK